MKIAINLWILRNKSYDGLAIVAINTIREMILAHPEVEFLLMVDKNFTEDFFDFPNANKHFIFPALRHPVLYILFFETVVPFFLRKHKPNVFVSMDSFLSLITSCKQVSSLADINFHHFPKEILLRNRIYYNLFIPLFAKKATRIVTLSNFSKEDIYKAYQTELNKIDIIYCGVRDTFYPVTATIKEGVKQKITAGKNYFFFVGSMNPRKNIPALLKAFDAFKKQTDSDFKLVLAGHIVWQAGTVKANFEDLKYKDEIIFLGRVTDEELNELLGSAKALCFVPKFEGFGLPVIEAWACEVPVIASNVTSVPEIGGDAVILTDPYDIQDMANKMQLVYENKDGLLEQLIEKGKKRKEFFTWKNTAALLWESIEKTMASNP